MNRRVFLAALSAPAFVTVFQPFVTTEQDTAASSARTNSQIFLPDGRRYWANELQFADDPLLPHASADRRAPCDGKAPCSTSISRSR